MPGKKPVAKERPSKFEPVDTGAAPEQSEVCDADAGLVEDGVEFAVEVGEGDGVVVVSLAHMLP